MASRHESASGGLTAVLVLAIGTFATGTDAFIIAGLVPAIAEALHASLAMAGQLVTVFALGYAIGSPLIVTVTATWPRRRVLVGSLLLFAAANVSSAISPSIAMLAATRVVAALLAGLFVPSAYASASALVPPEKRGRALAIVLTGTSLSTVLGVPVGLSVADLAGWRGAFLFVSALALAAAIGVAAVLPGLDAPPRVTLRERFAVLGRPEILGVLLVTVCANAGAFTVYTYLAPIFQGVGDAGTLQLLILTFGVAALLGGYLGGHGSDTWGPVPVLTLFLTVFSVNHLLLPFWRATLATSLAYMAIWGVVGWGTVTPQQHRLIRSAGADASIALSLSASALYLGISLGGLLGGYIVQTAEASDLVLPQGRASGTA